MDTKEDQVKVTVEWVLEKLLKLNDLKYKTEFPRVVKICYDCWEKKLKNKLESKDLSWEFSKEI